MNTSEGPGARIMIVEDDVGSQRGNFDDFFDREQADLLRFCWGITLDAHRAADIAQETMARAFLRWDELESTNPTGWLRTVALNLVRTQWRSEKRRDAALRRLASQPSTHSGGEESISRPVREALRNLTDRQREAVVLHHMFDLSVAEVAEVMDVGIPSVKTHLQRGRANLSSLLGDQFGGAEDA